jgi:hypothetical protein
LTRQEAESVQPGDLVVFTNSKGVKKLYPALMFVPAGSLRPDPDNDCDVFEKDRLKLDMGPNVGTLYAKLEKVELL